MRTNDNGAPKAGSPQPISACTKGRQSTDETISHSTWWSKDDNQVAGYVQQAERGIDTAELAPRDAPHLFAQRGAKYETGSRLTAPMKLQVERLAIPQGNWKTVALRLVMLLVVALPLFFSTPAWAEEEVPIAVIYPDIDEPYRGIFENIIEGIENKAGTRVANYPVRSDTDISGLKAILLRQNTKVLIALGRQGMKVGLGLNNDFKVVVGGVLTVPENETREVLVISLTPDPALLFARMKSLKPTAKRVFVVYDPGINGWLMKLAAEAADARGLELVAYEAKDLRSAVRFYEKIFSEADSRSDVLWLPQDPTTVEESSILPLVLQSSWNQNIAVFSSNVSHVRRGVLFSLYPDNLGLGKTLAGLAQDIMLTGEYDKRGMMPLHDVLGAGNLRTAKHLGIKQQNFAVTFPEQ